LLFGGVWCAGDELLQQFSGLLFLLVRAEVGDKIQQEVRVVGLILMEKLEDALGDAVEMPLAAKGEDALDLGGGGVGRGEVEPLVETVLSFGRLAAAQVCITAEEDEAELCGLTTEKLVQGLDGILNVPEVQGSVEPLPGVRLVIRGKCAELIESCKLPIRLHGGLIENGQLMPGALQVCGPGVFCLGGELLLQIFQPVKAFMQADALAEDVFMLRIPEVQDAKRALQGGICGGEGFQMGVQSGEIQPGTDLISGVGIFSEGLQQVCGCGKGSALEQALGDLLDEGEISGLEGGCFLPGLGGGICGFQAGVEITEFKMDLGGLVGGGKGLRLIGQCLQVGDGRLCEILLQGQIGCGTQGQGVIRVAGEDGLQDVCCGLELAFFAQQVGVNEVNAGVGLSGGLGGDVFHQQVGGLMAGVEIPEQIQDAGLIRLADEQAEVFIGQAGFTLGPGGALSFCVDGPEQQGKQESAAACQ
jgi:hypothetical protein